ncbi:MAG: hypothetical protein ACBR13_24615 [Microcoleus sp.]
MTHGKVRRCEIVDFLGIGRWRRTLRLMTNGKVRRCEIVDFLGIGRWRRTLRLMTNYKSVINLAFRKINVNTVS